MIRNPIRAALAALLLIGSTLAAWPQPGMAGSVLTMAGSCTLQSGSRRVTLKPGDGVHVGDILDVPVGARLKLRMNDGSVISAAPGTHVTIEHYTSGGARDVKLSLTAGLLRAVVSAVSQPSHFEIDTATGVAAVRSTDWFIEALPDSTQIGVLAGKVTLTSAATQRTILVPARWGARVEAGRDPVPARVWSEAEFGAVIARTESGP